MSRLKKGEMAPGVKKIAHRARSAVERFIYEFELAKASKETIPIDVKSTLRNYKSICDRVGPVNGGKNISENTIKKYIDMLYPGGLTRFNSDRALFLKDEQSPRQGTKLELQTKLKDSEEQFKFLVDEVLQFSEKYLDLLETSKDLANSNLFLKSELASHLKYFSNSGKRLVLVKGAKKNE